MDFSMQALLAAAIALGLIAFLAVFVVATRLILKLLVRVGLVKVDDIHEFFRSK